MNKYFSPYCAKIRIAQLIEAERYLLEHGQAIFLMPMTLQGVEVWEIGFSLSYSQPRSLLFHPSKSPYNFIRNYGNKQTINRLETNKKMQLRGNAQIMYHQKRYLREIIQF